MTNNQQSVKSALRYGFIGAPFLVFIYECYANVMPSIAIAIALCGILFVAIRLCKYELSDGLSAGAFFLVISAGLGLFLEIMLHDRIVAFLEKSSKYFHLDFKETIMFVVQIVLCYVLLFIIIIGKAGVRAAINKIKNNGERSATFIENAFSEDDE